jgi:hypothetical protein
MAALNSTANPRIRNAPSSDPGRGGNRDGGGQQKPGGHVVQRGRGHGHGPDRPLEHPPFDQDAGQHREGGDGQGRPNEQRERRIAGGRSEEGEQRQGQGDPQQQGDGHAGGGDERRLGQPTPEQPGVQFQAHEEHVEGQSKVGHRRQQRDVLGGEQVRLDAGH